MTDTKKGPSNDLKCAALDYARTCTPVFPLKPGDKTPIHPGGFHNATTDLEIISRWWVEYPDANIGIPQGAVTGEWTLDIDTKNGNDGYASLEALENQYGFLPKTRSVLTPNGGTHYRFHYPGKKILNRANIAPGIDVRGDGGYVVAPPSRLADGSQYRWSDPEAPVVPAPQWLIDMVTERSIGWAKHIPSETGGSCIPNGRRNDTLIRIAGGLRRHGADEEQIFDFLWSVNLKRCVPPLDEKEVRGIAASAQRWQPAAQEFPLTDAGNAEFFAYLNTGQLLYDHKLKRWLTWQEHCWGEDHDGDVILQAKNAARERQRFAEALPDADLRKATRKFAIKSENRSRLDACIELAKAEPGLSDSGDAWDADPLLLGVLNGVVELRTGVLRTGEPTDRISLHCNVQHDPAATCPRWEQFMQEIFDGDQELIAYVRRAVGYSLTGQTSEHIMFLGYGSGANGKSVMLRVLCDLAGSYAKVTPASTLDATNKSVISNDVAAIAGRRMVWASETEQASTFNEAKVKQLVHGDEMTARYMYREFFTFTPVAKFWLTVNDLPAVRDGSYGMWRSIHVIPFTVQFDGDKADAGLTEKLKAELPGILNWAIGGCLEWQQKGLCPPYKVTDATAEYKVENDALADFIATVCDLDEDKSVSASVLQKAYKQWAEQSGLKERDILSHRAFFNRLKAKFKSKRTNQGKVYFGLCMKDTS